VPFDEAWARLGIDGGTLAVVGGTETFGLFLTIGYDAFYLTRTDASIPKGRPVFPGVGTTTTAEEVMAKHGLVLKDTRMLDASVNCRVEEWVKR
jgi:dihydrofolate reductase